MLRTLFSLLVTLLFHSSFLAQTVGVVIHKSGVSDGYFVISPMGFDTTYLLNNCGRVLNSWSSKFKNGMFAQITSKGTLVKSALDEKTAHFVGGGASGILLEYDWNGNLLWEFKISDSTQRLHHDLEVLPNGNILGVAWEIKSREACIEEGRDPQNLPEKGLWFPVVYEIKPIYPNSASIVWEWHAWDHLIQDFDPSKNNYGVIAKHPERIDVNKGVNINSRKAKSDWAHINGIHYNADLDHICLSAPKFNEIWMIDHSSNTDQAATSKGGKRGKGGDLIWRWGNPSSYDQGNGLDEQLSFQHNCEWVDAGSSYGGQISVFSNREKEGEKKVSGVKIIDAKFDHARNAYPMKNGQFLPSKPSYTYTLPFELFSPRVSGVQVLPNGNKLICSGANGCVFEVDGEENIVWKYIVPIGKDNKLVRQGTKPEKNKSIFTVHRYPVDFSGFKGRDLTPKHAIELNPLPCKTP